MDEESVGWMRVNANLMEARKELARLKEENVKLRGLVQGYYTLLRVIQPGWEQIMAPHWDRQKDILQEQAKSFLKDVTQEGGE